MNFKLILIAFVIITGPLEGTPPENKLQYQILRSNKHKIKRSKGRVNYYANTVATRSLILCGDRETNPGPGFSKCNICNKNVNKNHRRIICSTCQNSVHAICSGVPDYQKIKSRVPRYHICQFCTFSTEQPFYKSNLLDLDKSLGGENFDQCQHKFLIQNNPKKLSAGHLNTQSLCSSFDEFSEFMHSCKFEIMTLSETWLKNDKHMIDYVQIEGYNTEFRHRQGRRGGGVGLFIKEDLKYKIRRDISNIEPDLEQLWVELTFKNKNSLILLGVLYQDNFDSTSKTIWLQKLDTVIGQLSSSWDGTIMICGDMNINTLDSTNPILNLYEAILNSYNLTRHINEPTRGNKVLDNIISNSPSQIKHCGVIPCPEISDHDSPYVIFDTKLRVYEPRYKYIRSMKTFDQKTFVNGFSNLPFSVIDGVDEPEDKLEIFNALITQYLEDHAPLKRIKITRAPTP